MSDLPPPPSPSTSLAREKAREREQRRQANVQQAKTKQGSATTVENDNDQHNHNNSPIVVLGEQATTKATSTTTTIATKHNYHRRPGGPEPPSARHSLETPRHSYQKEKEEKATMNNYNNNNNNNNNININNNNHGGDKEQSLKQQHHHQQQQRNRNQNHPKLKNDSHNDNNNYNNNKNNDMILPYQKRRTPYSCENRNDTLSSSLSLSSLSIDQDEVPGAIRVGGKRTTSETSVDYASYRTTQQQQNDNNDDHDIEAVKSQKKILEQEQQSTRTTTPATTRNSTTTTTIAAPVEAEIVDPIIEEYRVRNEILKELQATTPEAIIVNNHDKDDEDSDKKGERNESWNKIMIATAAICCCLVILIVAISVGVVVSSTTPSSSQNDSITDTSSSSPPPPPSPVPSMSPTKSPIPTGYPSMEPSFMPTSVWTQVGENSFLFRESVEGLAESDQFGRSVALSQDGAILAVGAIHHDFDGFSDSGQVQIFTRRHSRQQQQQGQQGQQGQDWIQLGQSIGGDASDAVFGLSVAMSNNGTIVAVGAPGRYSNGLYKAGSVQVYQLETSSSSSSTTTTTTTPQWLPLGSPIHGPDSNFGYGRSIALSSNGLIVGIGTEVGKSAVFEFQSGKFWRQLGNEFFTNGNDQVFVALSGDGTIFAEGSFRPNNYQGRVRVHKYYRDNVNGNGVGQWQQLGNDIVGLNDNDWFGRSVALSEDGTILAVGAPFFSGSTTAAADDSSSSSTGSASSILLSSVGHVRVFQYDANTNSWNPLGQMLQGSAADDVFGSAVSLSDDGQILVVGATQQFAAGNPPGYAVAYRLVEQDDEEQEQNEETTTTTTTTLSNTSPRWIQFGERQIGFSSDDDFGFHVAISGDGTHYAVGAPQFRTFGDADRVHLGYVRVLETSSA